MKGKVVAFVGTTPNIGTTAAALASAFRMAENTLGRVGYLCLNLKSAKTHRYIGIDAPLSTLDSLRPELSTEALTPDKLLQSMHPVQAAASLRILFGNTMRDHAEFFTPGEIDHLLDTAISAFDIVIADVGAYWDNAATICSLRRAAARVVVTTPALSHFQEDSQRWMKQLSPLFGIPEGAFEALVVQPPWRNGGYQVKEICKEMGVPYLGELKLADTMLSQLDSGTAAEWLAYDEQGRRTMAEASHSLMRRHGMKRKPVLTVQPWYQKLLAHRSGRSS